MAKKIYLIGGSKGGVGKSMVSMATLDYLLEQGESVLLIDSDTSNYDVWKTYQDSVESIFVAACNRKPSNQQSAQFSTGIKCN